MSKKLLARPLLMAMMATGLMFTTTATLAQTSRAEERRAERAAKRGGASQQAEAANRFPDATRKEPETKAGSRASSTRLGKLSDAYEAQDVAQTVALADEIIADEKSNAYERAIAARIAGSLLIGNDDLKALTYLQRAVEFDGLNNNDHYEVLNVVAQLQAQEDQQDQALATIDRLISETNTQDADILAVKGNILLRLERYPEAIAVLKPLVEREGAKPQWQQLLMAAYAEAGQGAEATRLAEQIAASTPDDKRSQLNLVATYLQTDQFDKAAAVLETLRAKGELTEERDYRNLMASYLNMDDAQAKAIEVINDGLAKNILKPDYQTYVALAQAYYFSEPSQVEQAITAYEKAAPLAPNGETYLNLAKLLSNEGRAAEAKKAAQNALEKGIRVPDEANRIISRGN